MIISQADYYGWHSAFFCLSVSVFLMSDKIKTFWNVVLLLWGSIISLWSSSSRSTFILDAPHLPKQINKIATVVNVMVCKFDSRSQKQNQRQGYGYSNMGIRRSRGWAASAEKNRAFEPALMRRWAAGVCEQQELQPITSATLRLCKGTQKYRPKPNTENTAQNK